MERTKRRSLFEIAGIPDGFRVIVLGFLLILILIPYFPAVDLGYFKIPELPPDIELWLKYLGPVIFILGLLLVLPIWPIIDGGPPEGTKTLILIDDEPAVIRDAKEAQIPGLAIHPFFDIATRGNLEGHLSRLKPHGVILDFDVPPGGKTLREWIREWSKELPVVIYTKHINHPERSKQMVAMGTNPADIIPKTGDFEKDILEIKKRFQKHWS